MALFVYLLNEATFSAYGTIPRRIHHLSQRHTGRSSAIMHPTTEVSQIKLQVGVTVYDKGLLSLRILTCVRNSPTGTQRVRLGRMN